MAISTGSRKIHRHVFENPFLIPDTMGEISVNLNSGTHYRKLEQYASYILNL
ncbi:hypothetical protein IIB79_11325 [candidate division KSB1 bacterium]|nr:hypothetical protein [candidate division KSB1 bacterium]